MKSYLAIILILSATFLFAQEQNAIKPDKRKELHLRITDFSPFRIGFDFKLQLKPKGFITVSLVDLGFNQEKIRPNTSTRFPEETFSIRSGIQIGYEFRKEFKEKFTFYHGPNIAYIYDYNKRVNGNPSIEFKTTTTHTHSVRIPYNIGIMYQLHKNILLSAQLSPSFSFRTSMNKNGTDTIANNIYNFGFANYAGTLAVVFRFNE